jgi:hypothetical protein
MEFRPALSLIDGWPEVGFEETAIDLLKARFWSFRLAEHSPTILSFVLITSCYPMVPN